MVFVISNVLLLYPSQDSGAATLKDDAENERKFEKVFARAIIELHSIT